MAQGRLVHRKISNSEQVADLSSDLARLVYTWAIPHSDDVGLLPHPFKSLKGLIIPMVDISLDDFSKLWIEIVDSGLITEFSCGQHQYWKIVNFFKYQRLRRDLHPFTYLKDFRNEKTPQGSWIKMLKIKGLEESVTEPARERPVDGPPPARRRLTDVYAALPELNGIESITNNKGLASKEAREGSGPRIHKGMRGIGDIIKSK